MERKTIYEMLTALNYKVYNIGQNYKFSDTPYLVLRDAGQETTTNRLGAFKTWEVQVYVPDTSMVLLDSILNKVEETLAVSSEEIRPNGVRGMDYHDTEINMYMNYIQFLVPRTVRGC